MEAYNAVLPATWSHNNPVDIIGDASPERYAKALEIAAKDPNSDGMLVILTPQAMTDPTQIAEQLKPLAKQEGKPVLASWMGGVDVAAGEEILNRANIPTFPYPDTAARAFNYMWQYSYNLKALYETPAMPEDSADWTPDRKLVERSSPRRARRRAHHPHRVRIQAGAGRLRHSGGQDHHRRHRRRAVKAADEIGYPVVLKLYSETITHKTDVGGVQLNLGSAEAVSAPSTPSDLGHREGGRAAFPGRHRAAHDQAQGRYELIIGSQPRPAVRAGAAVRHRRPAWWKCSRTAPWRCRR
jgi:acetyltransferase